MSRLATIRSKLNQLRIPELRNVLVDLNLARSGRKIELVDRIAMTLEVLFICLGFVSAVVFVKGERGEYADRRR